MAELTQAQQEYDHWSAEYKRLEKELGKNHPDTQRAGRRAAEAQKRAAMEQLEMR